MNGLFVVVAQAYPGLGAAGQLVEVRPGFARNFLVPRGLARLLNHFQGKEFKVKYAAEQQEQRDAGKRAQQGDVMNQVLERLTTHTVVSGLTALTHCTAQHVRSTANRQTVYTDPARTVTGCMFGVND